MKTLIPLSEYVLQQSKRDLKNKDFVKNIINYTKLLRTVVTLEMLLICDSNGNPMKKMKWSESDCSIDFHNHNLLITYLEKKCFFKGGYIGQSYYKEDESICYVVSFPNGKSVTLKDNIKNYIEDLVPIGLELTPSALKLINIE